jgi:hypothetical protein
MFRRPTVLILGAGASCHFGYPTGQQLVDGILSIMNGKHHPIQNANKPYEQRLWFGESDNAVFYGDGRLASENPKGFTLSSFLDHPNRHSQPILMDHNKDFSSDFLEACRHSGSFYQTLKSFDPINIDAFLGLFKGQFEKIGKYWIAKYLLECENTICFDREHTLLLTNSETSLGKPRPPRNENWYRYLLDALLSGIQGLPTTQDNRPKEEDDFLPQDSYKDSYQKLEDSFSNLFVLTFNYDVSLEYSLLSRLSDIPAIGPDYARYLLTKRANIHHVYGSLYDPFGADLLDSKKRHIESYGKHYENIKVDKQRSDNDGDKSIHFRKWAKFCWDCASNIHTIGGEKQNNDVLKDEIQKKIWDQLAVKITPGPDGTTKPDPKFFFLGFGFDPQNTELIGFHNFFSNAAKKKNTTVHHQMINAYWTNYNNSNALRQKFLSATQFDCYTTEFSRVESKNSSSHTVHQALTYDFSFL